jgi:hypothetical protein
MGDFLFLQSNDGMIGRENDYSFPTGKRSAVQSNSGPSVDHSDPVLREPIDPSTTDQKSEACPPNVLAVDVGVGVDVGVDVGVAFGFGVEGALSQHKSGQESENGVLSGGREASGVLRSEGTQRGWSSSLDEYKNNRNTIQSFKKLGRNRNCGLRTFIGFSANETKKRAYRLNCKTWACCYCGPRKAKRYRFLIAQLAERARLTRFLTLTLDPSKIQGDSVRHLRRTFDKFRLYLGRRYGGAITYISVLEFQKNGNAHLHVLVDRYIDQAWIQESWSALGGGRFVDIRYVDVHNVSRYLSKYLTKQLLLSAPLRYRRVTTSRSLHLIEKKIADGTSWTLLDINIFFLYLREVASASQIQLDEDGFIESFSYVSQTI